MSRRTTIACSILLIAMPCLAHKDAFLTWNSDGTLGSLPAEYQPAALHISLGPAAGNLRRIEGLTLTLAGRQVTLPHCVIYPIRVPSKAAVRVLGSWYHDLSMGPPYMYIELFSVDPKSTSPKDSRILYFNLRNAHLVAVGTSHYSAHESVISNSEVDFRAACHGERLELFSEAPQEHRPNTSLERTRER